jgi:sn-glycerol 3-phosphate transport system substrate-binding protein
MTNIIREIKWRGAVCAVTGLMLAALSFPALAAPKKPKAPAAEPAPPQIQQIEISQNSLSPAGAKALQGLVERFNAQSKGYEVVFVDRDWRAGSAPHLLVLDGANKDAFLAAGKTPRYKSLASVMKGAGIALQTLRSPAVMTPVPVGAKGELLALPVGLSTPVLYVNREAFRRAKVDPDTRFSTWADLQKVLGKLAEGGSSCPYTIAEPGRVIVENASTWHNIPLVVTKGKQQQPVFNSLFQVKHLALMSGWNRARLLRVFPSRAEAEAQFASGKCALIAAPSDSWAGFRQAGVDVGVARLPYHEDFPAAPQNTLADGAALWVSAGKKPGEYKGVATFVSFWLQPDNQIAWQRETGYLPLNRAGLLASESSLLGSDLENIKVAIAQLSRPATNSSSFPSLLGSDRAHRVIEEELAAVWAGSKPAKTALDDAVLRVSTGR